MKRYAPSEMKEYAPLKTDWRKYHVGTGDTYACQSIEYRYGSQNYDSGHDPDAPLTFVIIHFHDGASRTIKVD